MLNANRLRRHHPSFCIIPPTILQNILYPCKNFLYKFSRLSFFLYFFSLLAASDSPPSPTAIILCLAVTSFLVGLGLVHSAIHSRLFAPYCYSFALPWQDFSLQSFFVVWDPLSLKNSAFFRRTLSPCSSPRTAVPLPSLQIFFLNMAPDFLLVPDFSLQAVFTFAFLNENCRFTASLPESYFLGCAPVFRCKLLFTCIPAGFFAAVSELCPLFRFLQDSLPFFGFCCNSRPCVGCWAPCCIPPSP
jgi:hypothetical protein